MSVTKQQVLDALEKLRTPRGVALIHSGALSEITLDGGKVMFSINVDAAEARAWESVACGGGRCCAQDRRGLRRVGRAHCGTQGVVVRAA